MREECDLLSHHCQLLLRHAAALRLPDEVAWTALVYLRRLYLHHSMLQFSPHVAGYTCLALACKASEFNVSLDTLTGHDALLHRAVVTHEPLLLAALRFHVVVYTPVRALRGLLLEAASQGRPTDEAGALALREILRGGATDAVLRYAPSQLALAALHCVAPELAQPIAGALVSRGTGVTLEALLARLDAIGADSAAPPVSTQRGEVELSPFACFVQPGRPWLRHCGGSGSQSSARASCSAARQF